MSLSICQDKAVSAHKTLEAKTDTAPALSNPKKHGKNKTIQPNLDISEPVIPLMKPNQGQQHFKRKEFTLSQPNKELIENIKHGTTLFPLACYIWQNRTEDFKVALHWHKEIELVRLYRGHTITLNVDMQELSIDDDAFIFIPGNVMHSFTLPAHCHESAIVFDPHMLLLQHYDAVESEIMSAVISGNIPLPPIITKESPVFNEIDTLYSWCVDHAESDSTAHRLMIKARLIEILATYYENGLIFKKDPFHSVKKNKQERLKELLGYIDNHYAGPITIKDAAQRLNVTEQYFCRFFKNMTEMSFTEYLNDLRLRRAAREIEMTTRSISDISIENGFDNTGYFFKSFKQKFGITPLKFRKKFLEGQVSSVSAVSMPRRTFNDYNTPLQSCGKVGSPFDPRSHNKEMKKEQLSKKKNSDHLLATPVPKEVTDLITKIAAKKSQQAKDDTTIVEP